MRFLIPSYFNAPINPEDRALAAEVRQKVIPWSKTPFDSVQDDPNFDEKTLPVEVPEDDEEAEHLVQSGVEPVPEWLELFFDLAWTITFSGLSGNTPIKGAMTVVSFVVFFVLAWWLWIAQALYDTKFYVNDAWHRFILLLQFTMFGALCAWTSGFDITVGFKAPDEDIGEQAQAAYVKRAFQAISIVFFMTRIILAIQYVRVIRLARHRNLTSLYIILASLLASGILFLGAFFVVRANPDAKLNNGLKIGMWFLAIMLEVLAYCHSTMPRGLLTQGSMPARLSTLTTVVIGEGLNGFIDPITAAAKSVGFGGKVAGMLLLTGLIIFLVFVIYFQSFRARLAPNSYRQKLVVMAHLPVQLFIILLLEGLKSVLNILTLSNSLDYFSNALFKNDDGWNVTLPTFVDAYKTVGVDIKELHEKLELGVVGYVTPAVIDFNSTAVIDAGIDEESFNNMELMFREFAAGIQALFKSFDAIDGPTADKLNDYVMSFKDDSEAVQDAAFFLLHGDDPGNDSVFPRLETIIDSAANDRMAPAQWVSAVAGAMMLSLAFIMLINGLARNRLTWWAFVARIVTGVALCLIALININPTALDNWVQNWMLATIAIAYLLLYIVDYVIAVFQARALKMSQKDFYRAQARADAANRPIEEFRREETGTSATSSAAKFHDPFPGASVPRQRI